MEDIASQVLGKIAYWDEDLNKIEGLTEAIATYLQRIDEYGIKEAFSKLS
jgi:tagaturonate reductase